MEIDQSSLFREISDIINGGALPVHFVFDVEVYVAGVQVDSTRILRVTSIDFDRDYLNNYAERIHVTMAMGAGLYAKQIYPYLDDIDIVLKKTPISEVGDGQDDDTATSSERYTATMIDTGNPIIEMNSRNSPSEQALDLTNIVDVTFQLLDKSMEQLRMVACGTIVHDSTNEDLIKGVMTTYSQSIKIDKSRLLKGVDMVPSQNQNKRTQTVIPHGTKLVEIPWYVQYKCGGVYNAGMGYFQQGDYWYVYPHFDTTRFNSVKKSLTIITVPPNRFPGMERTYRLDGDNLTVLCTGEIKFRDHTNTAQLNHGNGARYADADLMMGSFVQTVDNKAIASRGKVNSEFVSEDRKNGLNNVTMGVKPINANPYVEYSALSKRQGSLMTFVWENANTALLYPGMPVRVQYLDNEDIKQLDGVLLRVHVFVGTKEPGMASRRHVTNTMLGVFVKPLED